MKVSSICRVDRRGFLFGAGTMALASGCRSFGPFAAPDLRFGVVSDIHVTTRKSCRMFERALRHFRRRGVDAVVVPGDLTDWGIRASLADVKRTWDAVFAGTDVVPLFCTGNHDYEGFRYGDMAVEMRANGHSEDESLVRHGLGRAWQETFGEEFADIRCRRVKGYDFVSCEYGARDGKALRAWMEANRVRLLGAKPFFFFQHMPIKGTTVDSFGWGDGGITKPILAQFPNCIAITGHTHRPFVDERQIWQGEFTAIGTPSLSYASFPSGYENGERTATIRPGCAMQRLPTRRDLRGGQGFVVSVWADEVVVERVDLEEESSDCPDWIVPLPACTAALPYANGVRDAAEPVPRFPEGATLDLETRNTEDRTGHWAVVLNCEFPSALMPDGHRVLDYEIRAVPRDGSAPLVRRFLSPAYPKMAKYEPERQRFWFNVADLPVDRDYVIEVRARNTFEVSGEPLVSGVFRGKSAPKKEAR